jgi:hypothetical protein
MGYWTCSAARRLLGTGMRACVSVSGYLTSAPRIPYSGRAEVR